jgi:hypothetical protein
MDVRVVEARTALTPEFKAAMKALEVRPASVRLKPDATDDADVDTASFDSVPGIGFDSDPVAAAIVPPPGQLSGRGSALSLDPAQNNAFRAVNAAWKIGANVHFDPARGRYIVSGAPPAAADGWVKSLALAAERSGVTGRELKRPRLAIYHPWTANIDEGWTRWLFENYGFELALLDNQEAHAGALGAKYDVIVVADDRPRSLLEGHPRGSVPARYEGGLGPAGVHALDDFVRRGGTLVCLNNASTFAIQQLQLPVKNVVADLKRQQFFAGGSILEVTTTPAHPVMAGMPDRAAVFFDDSPVFSPQEGFKGEVLARYAAQGSPLMSGYLLGEKFLQGQAAALDVRLDAGHVILIGFRPQWRGQPFGTFRILFNAAMSGDRR